MTQNRLDKSASQELSYLIRDIDANFDELFDVMQVLDADFNFSAITGVQPLLNGSKNGAVNLSAGLYFFESMFSLAGMSASSGSFGFALGGNAVFDSQLWMALANKASPIATEASDQTSVNVTANTALTAATTSTVGWAWIKGLFRLSGGGTVIPQITFTNAGIIQTVKKNSYFRVMKRSQIFNQVVISPPQPLPTPTSPIWS